MGWISDGIVDIQPVDLYGDVAWAMLGYC